MRPVFIAIILFVCASTFCYGQQGKVVIIDTLESSIDLREFNSPLLVFLCGNIIDEMDIQHNVKIKIDQTRYPNAIISGVLSDSFCLLLDNKWGSCKVVVPHTDTIHIQKWTVYRNGITDSTIGGTAYYHMENDSRSDEAFKTKAINKGIKNKGLKKLNSISVAINGEKYNIPVTINEDNSTIAHYCGYHPNKTRDRFLSNPKPGKVYKYARFHCSVTNKIFSFNARIVL